MQQSKSRTWANDDRLAKPAVDPLPELGKVDQEEEDGETDEEEENKEEDEYPARDHPYMQKKSAVAETRESLEAVDPDKVTETDLGASRGQEADLIVEPDASSAVRISDADWLRSKTSRLLGLLDDEEQAELDRKKEAVRLNGEVQSPPDQGTASRGDKGIGGAPVRTPDVDINVDNIRSSARLFVRNLPYDTMEMDLEAIFAPFGKVEEVSCFYSLPPFFFNPNYHHEWCRSYDDPPDRDI